MFHIEGIFFVAALCIVNAAFTVNIPENNVRDVEKCVNKICDQQCRQMGFAIGNCVGFTCECDKFTKSNDVEDNVAADDENATNEVLSDCNPAACDQLCRRLKFPGGVCVNGRCKCDNFRQDLELANDDFKAADNNAIEGLSDCNPASCEQLCRRLKFPGGACVNGRCKCDNFRQVLEIFLNYNFKAGDRNEIQEELSDCNPVACDQLCRRLKFPGGACVNGRCKCDNFRTDLELYANNYFIAPAENYIEEELSDCNPVACDQLCHRLKFPGGACVNGRCKCDNFRRELAVDKNDIGEELSVCNPADCDQLCRRLKFPGGACVNGRCKCDNFRQDLEPIVNNPIGAVKICENAICNQICRRLGFLQGKCAGDRCECSNFLTQTSNLMKILKEPVCDERKCNIRCREMHYSGGFCQLYKCECY